MHLHFSLSKKTGERKFGWMSVTNLTAIVKFMQFP